MNNKEIAHIMETYGSLAADETYTWYLRWDELQEEVLETGEADNWDNLTRQVADEIGFQLQEQLDYDIAEVEDNWDNMLSPDTSVIYLCNSYGTHSGTSVVNTSDIRENIRMPAYGVADHVYYTDKVGTFYVEYTRQ